MRKEDIRELRQHSFPPPSQTDFAELQSRLRAHIADCASKYEQSGLKRLLTFNHSYGRSTNINPELKWHSPSPTPVADACTAL
jgi:hypothetical protein